MAPMVDEWRACLDRLRFRDPEVPLVGNVTGTTLTTGAAVRDELLAQVTRPVQWRRTQATLAALGPEITLEAGDTRVLANLARNADPPLAVLSLGEPRSIRALRDRSRQPA
jgi:[acyl-carrier-protein] S-malonyltransferase